MFGWTTPLVFLEMNNPDALTAEEEAQDQLVSGLTSLQRLAIWRKRGVRVLDLPYVQPPLSVTQQAEDGLLLEVIGAPAVGTRLRLPGALSGHQCAQDRTRARQSSCRSPAGLGSGQARHWVPAIGWEAGARRQSSRSHAGGEPIRPG